MKKKKSNGSVLILVVWTVGSLALLAAALGSRCAAALEMTVRLEHRLQARYIALAGVQRCLQALDRDVNPAYDGLAEEWASSELLFLDQPVGAGRFTVLAVPADPAPEGRAARYGMTDTESRISLNAAPPEVFRRILAFAGAVEEDQDVIVDSILDWRDEDHEKGPYGAENFYYTGLSPSYECKDGPFESVEELLLVRGMTPELFSAISPHLTSWGSGRVNLNTASADVLRALGLGEEGIQGIRAYLSGEDSQPGTLDDRALPALAAVGSELALFVPEEDLARLTRLDSTGLLTVKSTEFEFDVTGEAGEGEKTAAVRIRGVAARDGKIRAWDER